MEVKEICFRSYRAGKPPPGNKKNAVIHQAWAPLPLGKPCKQASLFSTPLLLHREATPSRLLKSARTRNNYLPFPCKRFCGPPGRRQRHADLAQGELWRSFTSSDRRCCCNRCEQSHGLITAVNVGGLTKWHPVHGIPIKAEWKGSEARQGGAGLQRRLAQEVFEEEKQQLFRAVFVCAANEPWMLNNCGLKVERTRRREVGGGGGWGSSWVWRVENLLLRGFSTRS